MYSIVIGITLKVLLTLNATQPYSAQTTIPRANMVALPLWVKNPHHIFPCFKIFHIFEQ